MSQAKPRDYDAEMRLPEGQTCGDCFHFRRCKGLGYTSEARTYCDFWPRRYHPKPIAKEPA